MRCFSTRFSCSCAGAGDILTRLISEKEIAVGLGQKEHTKGPVCQHERQVRYQAIRQQVSSGSVGAKEKDPGRLRGSEMGYRDGECAHQEDHGEKGYQACQGNLDAEKSQRLTMHE